MSRQAKKIIIALIISLGTVFVLTKAIFVANSPRPNTQLIVSIPSRVLSFLKTLSTQEKKTIPTSIPVDTITDLTDSTDSNRFKPIPTNTPAPPIKLQPTVKPTATKIPNPAITKPIITPIPMGGSCPTTSSQSYSGIRADHTPDDLIIGNPETSPEINLRLRGFTEVSEGTGFVSRHGDKYGLDDKMPPQISTLFGGPRPQIIKTYRIYEWDFDSKKSLAPQTATPNFKVHMIGLAAPSGQKLVGLQAGRQINAQGDVFMVVYATNRDIVVTHSTGDTLLGGYLFYFLDICVDPNLLAAYESADAEGRSQLPVIGAGQVFGYAGNTDVKVSIRDTMSFMDERYNEDWWDYGK